MSVADVLGSAVAVGATLGAYAAVDRASARLGRPALANPVLWSAVAVVAVLAVARVPVDDYTDAARPLRWLLAPATVALAAPLAREARVLAAGGWRLVLAVAAGGVVASLAGAGVALALGAPEALVEALAAKSVTTPIAVAMVPGTATDSVVATAVVAAGTLGAIAVPALARRGRPRPPGARSGWAWGSSPTPSAPPSWPSARPGPSATAWPGWCSTAWSPPCGCRRSSARSECPTRMLGRQADKGGAHGRECRRGRRVRPSR